MLYFPNFADNFEQYRNREIVIDDFDFKTDAEAQAAYAEGGDGGNPTVRDEDTAPLWKVSSFCARFPATHSTGTSTWTRSTGLAIDLSEYFGVDQGTPTRGLLKLLAARSSSSAMAAAVNIRIGSDGSNYGTFTFTMSSTTETEAIEVAATTASITGTPDWTNIDYIQIIATTSSSTPALFLSGLRCTTSTRVTGGIWSEDAGQTTLGSSLFFISNRQVKPTLLQNGTASTDVVVNKVASRVYNNFTGITKFRYDQQASGHEVGIAFFIQDITAGSEDMYTVCLDANNNEIQFDKWVAGTRTTIKSKACTNAIETDYWIKVEMSSGRLSAYVSTDGDTFTKYLETTDTTYTSGAVGTYTRGQVIADFYSFEAYEKEYVRFDDWGLHQRGELVIDNIEEKNGPEVDVDIVRITASNRTLHNSRYFGKKLIAVTGKIVVSDPSLLNDAIENLKEHLSREAKNLVVAHYTDRDGVFQERMYRNVTVINLDDAFDYQFFNKNYVPFRVIFQAPNGFGVSSRIITDPQIAWSNYTFSKNYIFKGTGAPLPVIEMNLTDATPSSGNLNTLSIYNATTNQTIILANNSNFANSDVVKFDFENITVTLNGNEISYTGVLSDQFFVPGLNKVTYTFYSSNNINQTNPVPTTSTAKKSLFDYYQYSQAFQVSGTTTYPRLDLYLARFIPIYAASDPAPEVSYGSVRVQIETNSGGLPTGTLVNAGATKTIPIENLPYGLGSAAFIQFDLGTAASLTASTTYHITVTGPGVYIPVSTSNNYATGAMAVSFDDGTTWTADANTNHDMIFKIYQSGPSGISGTLDLTYRPRYV